jgi:prevent-host-death family protein
MRCLPSRSVQVIYDLVRTVSLATAKAHISELVDDAAMRGKRVLISRHGKPVAAIVPVEVATPKPAAAKLTAAEADEFLKSTAGLLDADFDAVADLLASRR